MLEKRPKVDGDSIKLNASSQQFKHSHNQCHPGEVTNVINDDQNVSIYLEVSKSSSEGRTLENSGNRAHLATSLQLCHLISMVNTKQISKV